MRRRKEAPSDEEIEIIDSDDQDQMIRRFTKEMEEQQSSINNAFRALCIASAVLSLLALFFLEMRNSLVQTGKWPCWMHAAVSAALHVNTPVVASPSTPASQLKWCLFLPWAFNLLVGACCLFHARSTQEDATITITFHQGILIGNAITTVAALWLRSDSVSIKKSVEHLKEARYAHKSL